jgi:hypothetical protein
MTENYASGVTPSFQKPVNSLCRARALLSGRNKLRPFHITLLKGLREADRTLRGTVSPRTYGSTGKPATYLHIMMRCRTDQALCAFLSLSFPILAYFPFILFDHLFVSLAEG